MFFFSLDWNICLIIFQSESGLLPLLYCFQNLSADTESEDNDEADNEDDADEEDKELNEESILNMSQLLVEFSLLKCGQPTEVIWGSQLRLQVELTVRSQLGKDIQYSVRKLRKCYKLYT